MLVILYHGGNFGFTLPHDSQRFGWIGVDLFFVLSGYLIGGQLLASLAQNASLDLPRFFSHRALRILPAYLAVLAVYAALPAWREWPNLPPLWRFLAFVHNLDLYGGTAFSHAWSLCVEAQFYLALPFLLLWTARHRGSGPVLASAVILGGLLLRASIAYTHPSLAGRAFQHLLYYPTWARLDPLVWGVTLAAVERFRPHAWQRLTRLAPFLLLPALALIASGLYLGESGIPTFAACVWQFPLIALGLAAVLVCSLSGSLPLSRLAVPGASFLATTAYSTYLSHKLVLHAVKTFCVAHSLALTSAPAIFLNLSAILLVGSALFFVVERPFLRLRRRSPGVTPAPAT